MRTARPGQRAAPALKRPSPRRRTSGFARTYRGRSPPALRFAPPVQVCHAPQGRSGQSNPGGRPGPLRPPRHLLPARRAARATVAASSNRPVRTGRRRQRQRERPRRRRTTPRAHACVCRSQARHRPWQSMAQSPKRPVVEPHAGSLGAPQAATQPVTCHEVPPSSIDLGLATRYASARTREEKARRLLYLTLTPARRRATLHVTPAGPRDRQLG